MTDTAKLRTRLANIWEAPNLYDFFKKYAKRPPRHIKKGTLLFHPGDRLQGVYFIQQGFIKLYEVSEEGRETIIYLTGPGNLLSLRALVAKEQTAHQYTETITDVVLYSMTMQELYDILSDHPEHLVDLLHVLVDRLNHAERRVEGFIAGNVTVRVANFLYDIALRFGEKHGSEVLLPINLTHQRISEFVGSFRETITLVLSRLQKEKLIKINRSNITILDLEKLHERSLQNRKQ